MAVYSINQIRHLYVAKEVKKKSTRILSTDKVGAILPKGDTAKTTFYFHYMSPGGLVSSDKITVENVLYAKVTYSSKLAHKLGRIEVTLDNAVSGVPVAGQEYILKIIFRQYVGLGEDNQQAKFGVAKATTGMTTSELYKQLALSLAKNLADDTTPLANVYLNSTAANGTDVLVSESTKEADLNKADYDKIIIEEVEQNWILGKMPQAFIPFTVLPGVITVNGDEAIWGKAEKVTPTKVVEDGKNIADLEYFTHGFRGDEYRGMGYPNNIITTYLVDASKKYDTLDIHYSYIGSNESVQKSEKTITIVCENDGVHTDMKALIAVVNDVSGLQIADPED